MNVRMIAYTTTQKIEISKCDLIVINPASTSLSIYDCIALCDWIQTSNNGIEHLKTGLDAITPALSSLVFPLSIHLKISRKEKVGVTRSRVVELDCVITRAGNCQGMHTYYYCENPMQLIMNMLQACIISGEFMNSSMFCGHSDQICVALGGDKSDNDYVFVVRICNRRKGNAGIHCEMVSCLKGPVIEEYTNAKTSVGNPLYPTMPAFQNLLHENYHTLIFEGMDGQNKICTTSSFLAIPTQRPLTRRSFNIRLFGRPMQAIYACTVEFDDKRHKENNNRKQNVDRSQAMIHIPLCKTDLEINLVHASNDQKKIIGYQLWVKGSTRAMLDANSC